MKKRNKNAFEFFVVIAAGISITICVILAIYATQMIYADVKNRSSPKVEVVIRGECYSSLVSFGRGRNIEHVCFVTEGESTSIHELVVENATDYKDGDKVSVRKYSDGHYVLEDVNASAPYFLRVLFVCVVLGVGSFVAMAIIIKNKKNKKNKKRTKH